MPPGLKSFLLRWLISTLAVSVAVLLVPGINYKSNGDLLLATLLLGVLNTFVRPLLLLLSLPLLIFTLGLFSVFINAVLLYFVGNVVRGFQVATFPAAIWGALIISIVSLVLNTFTGLGNTRLTVHRGPPPPGPDRRKDDDDDVIDV
ncbi:MAG TPA: phage holin family protein [Dongiaceae bacterium]|jgi:putative membrane protein|nr:phage holin family protein [Dongiaceae bacterium]